MDYDKLIAPAAAAMRPSGIRKFFDLAAEMPECISLGVGEPDFKTPWAVREAGIESLEHGRSGRRDQFIVIHHSTVHSLSSISSS